MNLKVLLLTLASYFPRRLPVGMTEFQAFADRIVTITGPIADEDSLKYVVATQVLSLGPQRSSVPDRYFVKSIQKAAANQVASQTFQDIKAKQKQAELDAKKAAEVTAIPTAATSSETK